MNYREAAVEILLRAESGGYLNLLLNSYLTRYDFSEADRASLTRLVYSVTSHRLTLEYGMLSVLDGKKIKKYEHCLLLTAYCQMVYFDRIPDYAIINESVALVKKKRGKQAAGFINALLRRLAMQKEIAILTDDPLQMMSLTYSEPLWLVRMMVKQYSQPVAEKIFAAFQQVPPLTGRVNTLKISKDELLSREVHLKPGKAAKQAVIFTQGNIASSMLYQKGYVTIQDESSQLAVEYLDVKPGMCVLDMCAAPGSKTTYLSALMNNQGEIHAYDIHPHKIALIEENARRLGCTNITARAYDATKLDQLEAAESFDAILLDAPCSGLGVLARKPEIRYHDSKILDEVVITQRNLLEIAVKLLKRGGILVYSTCTLNKKENEKNIEGFLAAHREMRLEKQTTILPYVYQSDGFYMAKMVKE